METTTSESTPSVGGSSKKGLIIGAVVVGLIVVGSVARNFRSHVVEQGVYDAAGGHGTVTSNGDGQVTVKNEQGEFTSGNKLPSDWPSDVPVYTGATVQYAASVDPQTGKAGEYAMFQSSDSVEKVAAYYNSKLVAEGWKITANAQVSGGTVIAATKGDRELGLNMIPAANGTMISIGASMK